MAFEIRAARFNITAFTCVHKYRNISSIRSESYDHRRVCTYPQVRSNFLNEFLGFERCESYRLASASSWVNDASQNRLHSQADNLLTAQHTIQCLPSQHLNGHSSTTGFKNNIIKDASKIKPLDMNMVLAILSVNSLNVHQNRLHSFDPVHYIRVVDQSPDDIILLSNNNLEPATSVILPDDSQQSIISRENCQVTVISECMPFPTNTNLQHRAEFVPLTAFEKKMMLNMSDINSTGSSKQPSVDDGGGGKPSAEQLEAVFSSLSNCLPNLFTKPHDYALYHPEVVFQNNIRGVTTKGISAYVSQIALLRLIGHLRFAYVNLEVLKITKHPEDGSIRVRWRICGIPGYKMLITFWRYRIFKLKDTINSEQKVWYDGFSTFFVGSDGLVHRHLCDKMMPDDSKERVKQGYIAMKLALMTGLVSLDDLACMAASLPDMDEFSKLLPDL